MRFALGLGAANLDAQLTAIKGDTADSKAKTDQLTFTVPNQIDSNLKSVLDDPQSGSGTEADPYGPA